MILLWQWLHAILTKSPYAALNTASENVIFAPTPEVRRRAVARLKSIYQGTFLPCEAHATMVAPELQQALFNLAAASRLCRLCDSAFAKALDRHLDTLQASRYIDNDCVPYAHLVVEKPAVDAHPAYILAWLERSFPQRGQFYACAHSPYTRQLFELRAQEFLALQQPGEDLAAQFKPI